MLKVKNVTKTYKKETSSFKKNENFRALQNISFELEENKVLSIIGESGSGKTTLAKIICALLPFDDGIVEIKNQNILNYTKQELSNTVQMIFQNPYASFNPKLTIGYSLYEAVDKNIKNKEDFIREKLALVDMKDKDIFDKYPHQFSGGQKQRIAIARALLKKPKILIADEPFASLDVINQSLIMDIFYKIKKEQKTNIIFITHDISAAFKISDKILILQNGNMIKYGTVEDIKEEKNSYINELINATYLTE